MAGLDGGASGLHNCCPAGNIYVVNMDSGPLAEFVIAPAASGGPVGSAPE